MEGGGDSHAEAPLLLRLAIANVVALCVHGQPPLTSLRFSSRQERVAAARS